MWKAATHIVGEGTRVVVAVILARLLTPSDYGIAGMALVVAGFVTILTDPALGAALIQRKTITEKDRSTVFWIALGIGSILTLAGIALSGVVADMFGEPQVRSLFAVMSITFVLVSLSVTPRALLWRKLSYRSLEIRDMASTLIGAAAALIVAFAGFGPWAIVANSFAYAIASTSLIWVLSDWRPRWLFSTESLRSLGGFSGKVFSAQVIGWGNMNMDNVLIGRFLGAAPLGAYSLAYNLMYMPMTRIARPLAQVLSPAYSRIQDDRVRLEAAWLRSKRISFALVAPCFLGIIVVAPDLVHVAFGRKWEAAITPLQLLCVAGAADALGTLNWAVLQACGKAGTLLRMTLLTSVVTIGSFAVGLPWGIVGVAGCYAAASWLLLLPKTWMTTRGVAFGFWPAIWAGLGILPVSLGAAAAAVGVRELLLTTGVPAVVRVAAAGATITIVYVLLLSLIFPSLVAEVRQIVRQRRRRAQEPAAGPVATTPTAVGS